ncbi:11255_t:CDS:2, partial [Rhizophagus irregularis]
REIRVYAKFFEIRSLLRANIHHTPQNAVNEVLNQDLAAGVGRAD